MLKLEATNHSYYCECWESKRTLECESWEQFKKEEGLDYDFDYNLLFRFDIDFHDDPESKYYGTYTLKLHHALQRHGYDQWHVVIHNIKEEDLPEIEEHLTKAKKHLLSMWGEIGADIEKTKTKDKKQKKCSICGNFYEGHGNSAKPINNGECCNKCNMAIVIPRRAQDIINQNAN